MVNEEKFQNFLNTAPSADPVSLAKLPRLNEILKNHPEYVEGMEFTDVYISKPEKVRIWERLELPNTSTSEKEKMDRVYLEALNILDRE